MKKPVAASLAAIPTTRELLVFPEPRMLLSFVSNAGGYFVSLFILFLLLNLHFYSLGISDLACYWSLYFGFQEGIVVRSEVGFLLPQFFLSHNSSNY